VYREVLSTKPDHVPTLLALSKISLALGDVDRCQVGGVGVGVGGGGGGGGGGDPLVQV